MVFMAVDDQHEYRRDLRTEMEAPQSHRGSVIMDAELLPPFMAGVREQ